MKYMKCHEPLSLLLLTKGNCGRKRMLTFITKEHRLEEMTPFRWNFCGPKVQRLEKCSCPMFYKCSTKILQYSKIGICEKYTIR